MVFWDSSPFFFILPTHSNSEFKQRSGGVEAHFLKPAMKKRAGFKLSDFSQCLRCGVSVLHGLFFLWVWRRCWEVCPRCNLETRAQNKPPFPVPHEFSVISQIKFNFVLKKKVKVFDKFPHCPPVLSQSSLQTIFRSVPGFNIPPCGARRYTLLLLLPFYGLVFPPQVLI